MKVKLIYADAMSYNNLQEYDDSLLTNMKTIEKKVFFNSKYNGVMLNQKYVKKIYNYSDKKGLIKILSYIKSQIKLFRIIKKNSKYNIVHVQWFKIPQLDYIFIKFLKNMTKVKIVHTAHNVLPHDTGKKYFHIYNKIYKELDGIIVHTNNTKEEIIDKFNIAESKINVIPHGILNLRCNQQKFSKIANEYKEKYKGNEELVFLFIGQIRENKGIDLLCEAWAEEQELYNNSNLRLIIAGNAKGCNYDFNKIKQCKNVTLDLKFLPEDEFKAYVDIADVIVMPYREISQSGVLLSMIKERKCVLVSDVGGLADPFKYGKIGWILKENSKIELQNNILKIAKNKDEVNKILLDTKTWEYLNDTVYNWAIIGKNTEKFYNKILENK